MTRMSVADFKANFSEALEMVKSGEEIEVLYGRTKKPVARLVPAKPKQENIVLEPFDSVALHRLPLKENHRDPFDRIFISQAIARNLTLISADEKIALYCEDGLPLIW